MLNLRQACGGAVANLDGCLSKTGILKVFCGSGEHEGDACFAAGYAVAGFGGNAEKPVSEDVLRDGVQYPTGRLRVFRFFEHPRGLGEGECSPG